MKHVLTLSEAMENFSMVGVKLYCRPAKVCIYDFAGTKVQALSSMRFQEID